MSIDTFAQIEACTDKEALEDRLASALIYQRHATGFLAKLRERIDQLEDDEYEALLPDGTRCEWDERLRTAGALRVRKGS